MHFNYTCILKNCWYFPSSPLRTLVTVWKLHADTEISKKARKQGWDGELVHQAAHTHLSGPNAESLEGFLRICKRSSEVPPYCDSLEQFGSMKTCWVLSERGTGLMSGDRRCSCHHSTLKAPFSSSTSFGRSPTHPFRLQYTSLDSARNEYYQEVISDPLDLIFRGMLSLMREVLICFTALLLVCMYRNVGVKSTKHLLLSSVKRV